MTIIDISWPLTENTTGYKNKKTVTFQSRKKFEIDGFRESSATIDSHAGTHVDAPTHFLSKGKSINEISLDQLVGDCIVLDLSHVQEKITHEDLQKYDDLIKPNFIVLLKTSNSKTKPDDLFISQFVYLEKSGAHYLRTKNIKAVGIDYLGIERNQPDHETHKELMHHDIVIIEGLRLAHVQTGEYFFCCLPLAYQGLEASPARAILIKKLPADR